ncbi:MAG: S1 RNA-binding domain-containing protein [Erysipelotrichales bacterium]|nr:S1 RNA-binding domain-containing protein [Erysipelotrichales bacterium]MBR3693777.1 S1 RNA-binding domain-containing protein [Erysipelotrichales bacterium]
MKFKVGDIITAKVSGIQPYGAFVTIDENNVGLIHISEISEGFVRDVHQFVKEGDQVRVKVIDYDTKNHQARLSLKALRNTSRKDRIHMRNMKVETPRLGFTSLAQALPGWIEDKKKEMEEKGNEA